MANFVVATAQGTTSTSANILAGSPFEFVGRDSRVAVAMACGSYNATLAPTSVLATISFGSELQLENGNIPGTFTAAAASAAWQEARFPDNVVVDDVAQAGDRLSVTITNNDATDIANVQTAVRILPI